ETNTACRVSAFGSCRSKRSARSESTCDRQTAGETEPPLPPSIKPWVAYELPGAFLGAGARSVQEPRLGTFSHGAPVLDHIAVTHDDATKIELQDRLRALLHQRFVIGHFAPQFALGGLPVGTR